MNFVIYCVPSPVVYTHFTTIKSSLIGSPSKEAFGAVNDMYSDRMPGLSMMFPDLSFDPTVMLNCTGIFLFALKTCSQSM